MDLREDRDTVRTLKENHLAPISYPQGLLLQKEIGAAKYMECSAVAHTNVRTVFEETIRAALKPQKPVQQRKKCLIL